jgi:S1-C subfamily serine protease
MTLAERAPAARHPLALGLALLLWLAVLGLAGLLIARQTMQLPGGWARFLPPDEPSRLAAVLEAKRQALIAAGCTAVATAPGESPAAPQPTTPAVPEAAKAMKAELLARRLERSAVLVLTEKVSGSGFFIAPTSIMTNRHVVEGQADGHVKITSKSLGRVIDGQVVAISKPGEIGAPDFAVIKVAAPQSAEVLPVSTVIAKLQKIVVAGYPGLVIGNDVGFRKLLAGDVTAAPDLNLTEGSVSAMQSSAFGVQEIIHSATVLTGNSGGPLVDACGRVVGINTFITVDAKQSGHVNYALAATDLGRFLSEAHIPYSTEAGPCD